MRRVAESRLDLGQWFGCPRLTEVNELPCPTPDDARDKARRSDMDYRTIVTFVRDFEAERSALDAAAAMAEARGGHLTVVCLGIDRTQPGAYYAGASAIAFQQSLAEAQADAQAVEAKVQDLLKLRPRCEIVAVTAQIGAVGPTVADFTRFADLAIALKPYGGPRDVEDVAIVEGALFGYRTPVLVLPATVDSAIAPKSVVIAWNESLESLTAVRAAMPFLTKAGKVNIVIIDPPKHASDRSDPGGNIAELLARHGVRADISILAKTMPRVSDVLMRHVRETEGDLIVMGGYGHSRFREAILGGATRDMLEIAEVPVLMAH
jgi:nucleotide-binding universal stress UspA family protein